MFHLTWLIKSKMEGFHVTIKIKNHYKKFKIKPIDLKYCTLLFSFGIEILRKYNTNANIYAMIVEGLSTVSHNTTFSDQITKAWLNFFKSNEKKKLTNESCYKSSRKRIKKKKKRFEKIEKRFYKQSEKSQIHGRFSSLKFWTIKIIFVNNFLKIK